MFIHKTSVIYKHLRTRNRPWRTRARAFRLRHWQGRFWYYLSNADLMAFDIHYFFLSLAPQTLEVRVDAGFILMTRYSANIAISKSIGIKKVHCKS